MDKPILKSEVKVMRCVSCNHNGVKLRKINDEFDFSHDGQVVRVHAKGVPVEVCPDCGERYSGPDAAAVRHEAICRALGLLSPNEIRDLRERLGLTQLEFARLTGIGEATVSRWERGRLLQNRAMDRYLRLIASEPKNQRILKSLVA